MVTPRAKWNNSVSGGLGQSRLKLEDKVYKKYGVDNETFDTNCVYTGYNFHV